ncbi:putative phage abortive infection protein [Terrimonas alba]|uniref:putative phage abortive infection protein n=1 Tax=Terrimonas alba TaxID=3349636 RepID=UPI0035F25BAB
MNHGIPPHRQALDVSLNFMSTQSQLKTDKNEFSKLEKFLVGLAITFAIWGAVTIIGSVFLFKNAETFDVDKKINDEKFGNFGSLISGTVGALWSLVGVILFYITLRLQRKELAFQREELELTRGELQGQKEQMIRQNATLIQQRFETTFFQLLTLHHQIVNAMDLRRQGAITQQGRDVFKSRYADVKRELSKVSIQQEIEAIYLKFYKIYQTDFGHYFRNLYHILKYVNSSDISDKEKYRYSTLVRAQLSSDEVLMIFYNCLSKNGIEKFKPLIEKYHFF